LSDHGRDIWWALARKPARLNHPKKRQSVLLMGTSFLIAC
jgi:hypothetical protein